MKYAIRGINIKITKALNDFTEKKLSRLGKYFDAPPAAEANVVLSVLKDEHKVEVTIPFPGLMVRAEESSEDMYASVDLVVEKLERQIRKYKTKVNRKLRQEGSLRLQQKGSAPKYVVPPTAIIDEEEEQFQVVRNKRFNLKPMDTEEAILQMNMLGHSFFVFSNDVTDQVNIIYRRKDGKYGLIEPE
jgi:putative sigma-54 modulation protein